MSDLSSSITFEDLDASSLLAYINRAMLNCFALTLSAPKKETFEILEKKLGTTRKIMRRQRCDHTCDNNCYYKPAFFHSETNPDRGFYCGHSKKCSDLCNQLNYIDIEWSDLQTFVDRHNHIAV
jgi:hypothetical protein